MNLVKITSSLILLIFTCTTLKAQFNFDTYALEHVNIIDVNTKTVLNDYTIVISKDKILTILPSKDYIANDSVQSIVLKNKFIVPGLIDAHVHFATNPTEERRDNAEKVLKAMLLTGVTSVRDIWLVMQEHYRVYQEML